MRRGIIIATAVGTAAAAFAARLPEDEAWAEKFRHAELLLGRPHSAYTYPIPPSTRDDYARLARELKQSLLYWARESTYRRKNDPFIVWCTDPITAVTVSRQALSDCPPQSLRDIRLICIVGSRFAKALRPYASAAGARLEIVEPPKRPNQAMQRTPTRRSPDLSYD
jgi:hypothetical protein